MKWRFINYIFFILILLPFNIFPQGRIDFTYIGGGQGLSENIVNDIVQDRTGFIWLATNDGLNRYDGYYMEHFRYDPSNPKSLSSNVLECLLLGQDGKLWIGTSDGGLNKYNPEDNTFQRFQNNPHDPSSLNSGMIDEIAEDTEGNIWVNIRNKGIDRLVRHDDHSEFIHYSTNKLGEKYVAILKSISTLGIVKSCNGGIWVTSEKGIQHIIADKNQADNLPKWGKEANIPVKDIVQPTDSTIWIIYNNGNIVYANIKYIRDKNNSQLEIKNQFQQNEFVEKTSLSIDKQGILWLSSGKGLLKISTKGVVEYQYGKRPLNNLPTNRILCAFVDDTNVLWLGTYNNGALNYYINQQRIYNFDDLNLSNAEKNRNFFNNAVHSFCEDKYGALWVGTEGGGIARIKGGSNAFLTGNDIEETHCDFFDADDSKSSWLPDNNIYSLFCDSRDRIWIGSSKGLTQLEFKPSFNNSTRLTEKNLNIKHFSMKEKDFNVFGEGAVFNIIEDKYRIIWVAAWDGGLQRYLESQSKFERFYHNPEKQGTLSHNTIRSILFEPNGEAWIGTAGGGLNKMIFPQGKNSSPYFISYKNDPNDSTSISNNYILNVKEDKEGKIWIGTFGGGLNKIEHKNTSGKVVFKQYTLTNQLPNNTIKGILFDKNNNLWASTIRDLFRMNLVTGAVTQMTGSMKLKLDEFKDNANYQFKNGYMLWGGINGLMLFSPENFKSDSLSINACLTNLLVDNIQINPLRKIDEMDTQKNNVQNTKQIVLPYNKNTIEFGFSGMYFPNPKGVIYQYFLEGYEDKWLMTNSPKARYTKIPHGNYIFHVKASVDGVNWTGNEKKLQIIINPPYWLSSYAYASYIFLFLSIAYVIYRLILFRIKLKNQIKIEHIKLEQAEKTTNLKLQFFTNVSHELRTPLTLILNPIDKLIANQKKNSAQIDLLKMVQRNSVRLQNIINQLLDFRKMESGVVSLQLVKADIVPFVYEIFRAFEDVAQNKMINYRFSCEETVINCLFDSDKIEKILYNLLSNAFKFTAEKGTIILSLTRKTKIKKGLKKKSSEFLSIEVTDTGIGIKTEEQIKIFEPFYQSDNKNSGKTIGTGLGLAYSYNLVKMHHGKIKLVSNPGQGTKFTINIPLEEEVYKDYQVRDNNIIAKSEYLKEEISGLNDSVIKKDIAHGDRMKIRHEHTVLIVEDNKELLYFLKDELKNLYNIIVAPNGVDGIELTKKIMPDLIISDLMMPEMDGIQMCRILKTRLETCHIPIIILTAKTGVEAEKEGLETGADEYLLKPFKTELLLLRVKNLLETKDKLYQQFRLNSGKLAFKQASDKKDQELLDMVTTAVKQNLDNFDFDIEKLTRTMGVSRSVLYKKLKNLTDMSTTEFVRYIKLNEATNLFKQNQFTIEQVTHMVGFSDPKYFRECFKKLYGQTPSEYTKELKKG